LSDAFSNLLSGFIGAAVGGVCSVGAVIVQSWLNKRAAQREEHRIIDAFLGAVLDEFEVLWPIYLSRMGHRLEALPEGQPLLYYYPVLPDVFIVYTSNATLVPRIADPDLRRLVVRTIMQMRGLIASYRLNNDFTREVEGLAQLFQRTKDPEVQRHLHEVHARSAEYANGLRTGHSELKTQIEEKLIPALRRHLRR